MYDTQLTAQQQSTLKALTHKWNTLCEGDYESFDGYDSVEQAVAQLRKMGVSL